LAADGELSTVHNSRTFANWLFERRNVCGWKVILQFDAS
jgi:hypothetical protein